jgi:hypothetical protein
VWSVIDTLSFDCADPVRLAEFLAEALGFRVMDSWDQEGDTGAVIAGPGDASWRLIFARVTEGKAGKNRLHIDLTPPRTRDEEVERLKALGATVLEGFGGPKATWTVMQDPEGNEFCVLQGPYDPARPSVGTTQGGDA